MAPSKTKKNPQTKEKPPSTTNGNSITSTTRQPSTQPVAEPPSPFIPNSLYGQYALIVVHNFFETTAPFFHLAGQRQNMNSTMSTDTQPSKNLNRLFDF